MRSLKFWKKNEAETSVDDSASVIEVAPQARGFQPPPPRATSDQPTDSRQDALLEELRLADLAAQPENPWRTDADTIGESIVQIEAELADLNRVTRFEDLYIPPLPVSGIEATAESPAAVSFRIGDTSLRYEEPVDWAERGSQLARSDLELVAGNPTALESQFSVSTEWLPSELSQGLLTLASAIRDGETRPTGLTEVMTACPVCGHLRTLGICPACRQRELKAHTLEVERQRLIGERMRLLNEMTELAEKRSLIQRRIKTN